MEAPWTLLGIRSIVQLWVLVTTWMWVMGVSESQRPVWRDACRGSRGRIRLMTRGSGKTDDDKVMMMRTDSSLFVREQSTPYLLVCEAFVSESHFYSKLTLDLAMEQRSRSSSQRYVQMELKASSLPFRNAVNRLNETVTCMHDRDLICSFNMVIVAADRDNCLADPMGQLQCHVDPWLHQIRPSRVNVDLRLRSGFGAGSMREPTYAFYDDGSQSFVDCDPVDDERSAQKQSIRCPMNATDKAKPVLIRIESMRRTAVTAATPTGVLSDLTFFLVDLSQVVDVENIVQDDDREDDHNNLLTVLVIVAISLLVVVVVCLVLLFVVCFLRRRRRTTTTRTRSKPDLFDFEEVNLKGKMEEESVEKKGTQADFNYDKLFPSSECSTSSEQLSSEHLSSEHLSIPVLASVLSAQLKGDSEVAFTSDLSLNQQVRCLAYDQSLEVDRSRFRLGKLIGAGHFGAVYNGHMDDLMVAVKTTNDSLDLSRLTALISELKILTNLNPGHVNLVNLVGACTAALEWGQLYLILELCCNGDLKSYLIKHRANFEMDGKESMDNDVSIDDGPRLDTRLLLSWARGIASGMCYLSSNRIMHGDLAARNVLLDSDLTAKISDFGLSKHFYSNPSYRKQERIDVPFKWMALEFLMDGCFVLASDVWSYGVVLWEMFTLGREPYHSLHLDSLISTLKGGQRLQLPSDIKLCARQEVRCIEERVMRPAWNEDVHTRISFEAIVREIDDIVNHFFVDNKVSTEKENHLGYVQMRAGVVVKRDNSDSYLTLAAVKSMESPNNLTHECHNDKKLENNEYLQMASLTLV